MVQEWTASGGAGGSVGCCKCREGVDGDLAVEVAVIILNGWHGAGFADQADAGCLGAGGLVSGVVDDFHVRRAAGEGAEVVAPGVDAAAGGDGAVPVDCG